MCISDVHLDLGDLTAIIVSIFLYLPDIRYSFYHLVLYTVAIFFENVILKHFKWYL